MDDTLKDLQPLFTWRGQHIYPLFGAEGEGEDPTTDPSEDDEEGSGEDTAPPKGDGVTREEFDALRKQLSAADKRREDAEKRLKEIDDAKKDELTKATERAEELEKVVQERDRELADLRLQNAFLTADTGITWHDPADALDVAERRGYLKEVVSDDGKVDAAKLRSKLLELAKAKPHLVNSNGSSGEAQGKGKEKEASASGGNVGSKGSNGKGGGPDLRRYDKFLKR
jgi:hypothetical protein